MNNHYVYIYVDPKSKEPFYVGKGYGERMFGHLYEAKTIGRFKKGVRANWHKVHKIRKIQREQGTDPDIQIYENGLTEKKAFSIERKLIKKIGRSDLGLGPLLNLTDGGEGRSGFIFSDESLKKLSIAFSGSSNPMYGMKGELAPWWRKKHSEETKKKMSKGMKGIKRSLEARQNMSKAKKGMPGRVQSLEEKQKRSDDWKGRKLSEETKKKISNTLTGRKLDPEHAEKARIAAIGNKWTDEQRKRHSILMTDKNRLRKLKEK